MIAKKMLLCLQLYSTGTTNVYKLDVYAGTGSILPCDSMCGLGNFPTIKLSKSIYHLYWVESTINQQFCFFNRNGKSLGVAFTDIELGFGMAYFPCISLSQGETLHANFGATPLRYPWIIIS